MNVIQRTNFPPAVLEAVLLGLAALSHNAAACLTPDGADPALYRDLAGTSGGRLVWISGTGPTGLSYRFSGTLIDRWNVLTAAHGVPAAGNGGTLDFIGTGPNRFSDQGTVVSIVKWTRYPTYVSGFSKPDLAIINLAQPITIDPAPFAPVSTGEVVTAAGFGRYATPSTGLQAVDGASMGWRAPVLSYNTGGVSEDYFYSTNFAASNRVTVNGKGLSGDSGGPVWNAAGKLVGITVGQFSNLDPLGGTVAQRLDVPEVLTWIEANRARPLQTLTLAKSAETMRLTWNADATGYRLQTCSVSTPW